MGGCHWLTVPQDTDKWQAFVKTLVNSRVPYAGNFLTRCRTVNFSRRTLLHLVSYDL
jgi:hypothetical protein